MPITVNGVAISDTAIHAEMQHHPAPSREMAEYAASLALVARELMLQEAEKGQYLLQEKNTTEFAM